MIGFHHTLDDGGRGLHAQRFSGRGLFCARPGTPAGGLCPAEVRGYGSPLSNTEALAHTVLRTRSVLMCSKIVERFSNALILGGLPRFALPTGGVGAARSTTPSSGPAYGGPCTGSVFGPDAVIDTNKPTNKSMSVSNERHGQTPARYVKRRRLRAIARSERRPRRDVGRMAPRPVGNPAGRRIVQAEAHVGLLPDVNSVASKTPRADGAGTVNGGVSASKKR